MDINKGIVELLKEKQYKICTAESITGGKLVSSLIEVPGASKVIEQGYVVYSDQAKQDVLHVDSEVIKGFGVVSEEVALAMARGAKALSLADVIISTTGEAGPNPSEEGIVVGTVCFGIIIKDQEYTTTRTFAGDRLGIINNAVTYILNDLFYKMR